MNRLLKLVLAGSIIATGFIGCGLLNPDDSPTCDFTNVKVATDVNAGGGSVAITGEIKGSKEVTIVGMTVENSSGTAVDEDFDINFKDVKKEKLNLATDCEAEIAALSGVSAGTYKLTILTTVEETDFSTTVTFTVKAGTGTALTEETGTISNVEGPDEGAFDLVNGARIAKSGNDGLKDLMDISLAGDGFAGKLKSGNQTKFAASTEANYNAATNLTVKQLALAATADEIAIDGVGKVFVAKLGSSRGFAIVKITRYAPTTGPSTGDNKGEVDFSYKFTAN